MNDRGLHVKHVHSPNHVIHFAEPKFSHELPHLLSNEAKEIDHMFRLSGELLAQFGILRGNTHRTSIKMALAQHDAAHRDQRSGSETKLFRSEKCCNYDISASLQFAVRLYADTAAQVVHQQNLLRLGETQLPRNACVLNRTQRR